MHKLTIQWIARRHTSSVLDERLSEILKLLPSRELGIEHVFVGKRGEPMSKKWAEHNWKEPLKKLGIRHRKFYACRHTAITQLVMAEKNLKSIADYVGTSVAMIETNYCARQGLNINRSNLAQCPPNYAENMVAGPGFEPAYDSAHKFAERLNQHNFKPLRKRKVG